MGLTSANLHPGGISAIGRTQPLQPDGALGILESFNVATMIKAADAAAKTAQRAVARSRLAMAVGGKAFCSMTGDVASVQTGAQAGNNTRLSVKRYHRSGFYTTGTVLPDESAAAAAALGCGAMLSTSHQKFFFALACSVRKKAKARLTSVT